MAAVFGGAARVPMATLLMVTEMTGGYRLLVAAALAVFLSYLVQRLLSERLKYRSLYEAQVPTRDDSPTHHVEQLVNALRLVKDGRITSAEPLCRLELDDLLRSGVGVDLGRGGELALARPRPGSPWIGRPLTRSWTGAASGAQTVAILRNEQVLSPEHPTSLAPDDVLLLVLGRDGWAGISDQLTPLRDVRLPR
jgi:CIC family chloride channel protein